MSDKPLTWLGSSRRDMQGLPRDARQVAGFQLWRVQQGLDPNDWKPLSDIGAGVREIRIHTGLEHRVCYLAAFAESVYVLHVFEKKTRKTSSRDVEVARRRYRELVEARKGISHG